MREHIYTIPVNEAFETAGDECPFCKLYKKLEEDELTLILGASMMESDIRIKTNEMGFCALHYAKMMPRKNRLGQGLMLESHLDIVKKSIRKGGFLSFDKTAKPVKSIGRLEESCYICSRIENNLEKMFDTAIWLFEKEKDFRTKFKNIKCFCLPHYSVLLELSKRISKERSEELQTEAERIVNDCLDKLRSDVSWFCKKFDYRYESEPWGDSKDAIERSIKFLKGDITGDLS